MQRKSSVGVLILTCISLSPLFLQGQDAPKAPGPAAPSEVLGAKLIVWSETERPEPLGLVLRALRAQSNPLNVPAIELLPPAEQAGLEVDAYAKRSSIESPTEAHHDTTPRVIP